MKTRIITLLILCSPLFTAWSQDLFEPDTKITWLGIDCSALHFIYSDENISDMELQTKYFGAWNDLFFSERDKYNVAEATKRKKRYIDYYVEPVYKVNKEAQGPFINEMDQYRHLTSDDISTMVKKYDFSNKQDSDIGLVFILEGMDKKRGKASVWVTFIDMHNNNVLLTNPMQGEPGGFGFRNYWAKSFYNILEDMPSRMKKWKKNSLNLYPK